MLVALIFPAHICLLERARIYQFLVLLWVAMSQWGPDGNLESPVRLTIREDVIVVITLAVRRRYIQ